MKRSTPSVDADTRPNKVSSLTSAVFMVVAVSNYLRRGSDRKPKSREALVVMPPTMNRVDAALT